MKKDYRQMTSRERVEDFYKAIKLNLDVDITLSQVSMYFSPMFIIRKVQGELDREGDEFINRECRKIIGEESFKDYRPALKANIDGLMRSNFYLDIRYQELGFPKLNTFFDQEKNSRNYKVQASLLEYIIGFILRVKGEEEARRVLREIILKPIISDENRLNTILHLLSKMNEEDYGRKIHIR